MALGLHEAAHNAVDGVEGLIGGVGDEGGDDGVVGAFAFAEDVRVVGGLEDEVGGAVLEREAAVARDDARAEAGVVGVDEGDAVSCGVGYGEVDGVGAAVGGRGFAVGEWRVGFVRVEKLGTFGEILW